MNPADVAAKFKPMLHIHVPAEDWQFHQGAFACGTVQPATEGRAARPNELVDCPRCKRLITRIRGEYTYSGRRRAVAITGDTHS